jgi:hypothetical protein
MLGLGLFAVAGWLPPHQPGWSAAHIVQIFQEHRMRIRAGVALLAAGSVFFWPFSAAIATQMKRIEGRDHSLASTQLVSATGGVLAVLLPSFLWFAVAYRPDTSPPAVMQIFNDLAWLTFVGFYTPAVLQTLAIGVCILTDKTSSGIYPRWLGFANFWAAIGFMPGALIPFFQSGPFAWDGLISFWLAVIVFFIWLLLMWRATVRAIKQADLVDAAG